MTSQHRNLAVVSGTMTNEPTSRELPDGTTVVQFDVSTTVERTGIDGTAGKMAKAAKVSVPIAWRDPTAAALAALVPGCDVVVSGRIERRFFRVGGSTQSRTELVADSCLPARRRKSVRSLLGAARSQLEG